MSLWVLVMQATASEAVKPSRASVVARPNAAPELLTDKQEAGDSSPELNVHQGFLSAAAPSLGERPFQRGQRSQQPATLADEPTSRAGDADAKGQEAPQQSSRDHRPEVNKGKEAGRDPAGLKAKLDRDRSGSAKGAHPHGHVISETVAVLVLRSERLTSVRCCC